VKFARQVVLVLVLQGPGLVESQVRLSEVMADPPGSESHDEFVELSNIGLDTLDLAGWQLGDGEELDRIADAGEGTRLAPGAMALVLDGSYKGASTTYESVQELARIVTIEDRAFGRGGWSNSTPERVLVVSAAGDTVDVLTYDPMAGRPGHSWERQHDDLAWQLSLQIGGTPGRPNSVDQTPAMAGKIDLEVSPDPFAERLQIRCRLPAAPALLSVRIYDAEGILVARLRQWEPAALEEIVHWDGRHEDGRICAPGLYVVAVQSSAQGRVVHGKAVVARQ
jgi:hypothetical protein